jgi:uncharacterized protein with von Willebrand factor type A (vWA) domain
MFSGFIQGLRSAGVPVSITEHLSLMGAMQAGAADYSVEDFYFLARASLIKDERWFDRFDRVFAQYFKGLETVGDDLVRELPEEWLRKLAEKTLSPEEMAAVEALGGFDKLMETLRKRLEEQKERHQGGSKWIGTAGTSPFGAHGYNPEGVRIGQDRSRHRRAVKVWDKREFRDLDDRVELNTRTLKPAPVRPRGRRRSARPGRHHRRHGRQRRRPGSQVHPGAAQYGQGAAVPGYRRLDGRPRARVGGAVLRRPFGVQASGAFLLPQLRLRGRLEGQCAAARRADADAGGAAHLWPRLPSDLCRRRGHEPL